MVVTIGRVPFFLVSPYQSISPVLTLLSIGFSCLPPVVLQAIQARGIAVTSYEDLMQQGAAKPAAAVPPKPEEYCTIMYTSGTTGR
jgi:long-chain acyl-CoA synthetase